MNRIEFLGLLILIMMGSFAVNAQGSGSSAAITLERTACYGTCPVYTVRILDDGTVVYQGDRFVAVTGEQTSEITPETVGSMVAAFKNAGYFDWDDAYETETVSDLPTVTTSVSLDGTTHRIARYTGDGTVPLALPFLEQWIDEMANTSLWTGVQPDISTISNGTDTPARHPAARREFWVRSRLRRCHV